MKRFMGLHPVTWVLIVAAGMHLCGDLIVFSRIWRPMPGPFPTPGGMRPSAVGFTLQLLGLSLSYFVTAAMVEFLARIWDELRIQRGAILKLAGGAAGPTPDTRAD
jgi:hypothetical protein